MILPVGPIIWFTVREKAGLEDVKLHTLRHNFASFLINPGRSMYEVGDLLGHSKN
ncbi:tyrosine-type recombinase/integrase [Desulfonatronovibrio magnus]|uniref:tyrosine-type recombinase/integrase n=1 Tax=Desulfonatronovibrio magnus TaxID=698827 RepID=UPI0009FE230A